MNGQSAGAYSLPEDVRSELRELELLDAARGHLVQADALLAPLAGDLLVDRVSDTLEVCGRLLEVMAASKARS